MNKLIIFNEPVKSVRKSQQTIHSRIAKKKTGKYSMISGKNIKLKMKKSKKDKQVSFSLCRLHINTLKQQISFPVAQLVEHGASNGIMGSIPRESKS